MEGKYGAENLFLDLDIDGKIIITCNNKEWKVQTSFLWVRIQTNKGFL